MLAFLLRRLAFAVGTLILTAFFAYGMMRALRPEQYPGQATVPDLFSDVDRALLHLDFGGACMFAGCPSIKGMLACSAGCGARRAAAPAVPVCWR